MADKVQWGLSNVHIAARNESEQGVVSYGTPVALKGAVSLTLDPQQSNFDFYADNIDFFNGSSLTKYEGELEVALIPDWFKTGYLGYKTDTDGHLVSTNVQGGAFAIMFQVEGDTSGKKYAIYNCKANKPSLDYSTIEDQVEVNTETLATSITGESVDGIQCFVAEVDGFESLAVPTFPSSN